MSDIRGCFRRNFVCSENFSFFYFILIEIWRHFQDNSSWVKSKIILRNDSDIAKIFSVEDETKHYYLQSLSVRTRSGATYCNETKTSVKNGPTKWDQNEVCSVNSLRGTVIYVESVGMGWVDGGEVEDSAEKCVWKKNLFEISSSQFQWCFYQRTPLQYFPNLIMQSRIRSRPFCVIVFSNFSARMAQSAF